MPQDMTKEETVRKAKKGFEARKKKAPKVEDRHNNALAYAGSPMYFYCAGCGIQHCTLPESYVTPPPKYCEDCEAMEKLGLVIVE